MSGAPPDLTTRQRLLADLFAILPERETAALVAEMTLTTANSIADMVTALLSPAGDIVELDTVEGLLAAYAMARKRLLEELALLADAEKCAAFRRAALLVHGLLCGGSPATQAWITEWLSTTGIVPGEARRRPS